MIIVSINNVMINFIYNKNTNYVFFFFLKDGNVLVNIYIYYKSIKLYLFVKFLWVIELKIKKTLILQWESIIELRI